MNTCYAPDEDGVWRRSGFKGIAYSDGKEVEQRLLHIVSSARRVDTFAPDLWQAITDWPSEYHLSRARHCLLRPLGIRQGDRVLELGCGCGALTRYLGESGAEVVAVDGSLARARVAARRCRDLPRVRVYCDDLLEFNMQARFDWVMLVGVLEYAPLFSTENLPVEHYLRAADRFSMPGGALVVAIENQLGLKYFNACAEDHVGTPFFGVEGLYRRRTPVTYGRAELARRISSCGFGSLEWFYPFPDYKLPSVIIGAAAFEMPRFNVADLLARAQSRDYGGGCVRLFEEALVFAALHRNGLVEDLSNSFMVVARRAAEASRSTGAIAWSYAVNRHERFTTETTFQHKGGQLVILKGRLSPDGEADCPAEHGRLRQTLAPAPYSPGRLMIWRILEASARDASADEMAEAFRPWFRELLARATSKQVCDDSPMRPSRLADYQIDGGLIDCTPFNVIEHEDGLSLIDQEWHWNGKVPLGHVVCRGVLHSLALPLVRSASYDLSVIVPRLSAGEGLAVDAQEVAAWLACEVDFLNAAGVPVPAAGALESRSSRLLAIYPELVRHVQEASSLRAQLARLQSQCDARQATWETDKARAATVEAELRTDLCRRITDTRALRQLCDTQSVLLLALTRDLSDQAAVGGVVPEAPTATAAERELEAARQLIEQMHRELEIVRAAKAATEQAHQRLTNSRSWRLTAPLRALKNEAIGLIARVRA
jgi:SAM-dependent methyltransferase